MVGGIQLDILVWHPHIYSPRPPRPTPFYIRNIAPPRNRLTLDKENISRGLVGLGSVLFWERGLKWTLGDWKSAKKEKIHHLQLNLYNCIESQILEKKKIQKEI